MSFRPIARTTSRRWRMRRSRIAKQMRRQRAMVCTTSIGPGATNMVTAAALAHVNRLPVLFLPGDVYASRRPDPVLQQIEDFRRRNGVGQRLLPAGVALFRPDHPARAVAGCVAEGDRDDDRPRRLAARRRSPSARTCRPRRSIIRRASSSGASGGSAASEADREALRDLVNLIKGATAPLIIAGGGVHLCRRGRAARRIRDATWHSGRRNPGRQRRLAVGSSAGTRQHRRHRDQRGQRTGRATPTSSSASARGCRTSPPVRGLCSRIRAARSPRSTSRRMTRTSAARLPSSAMPRWRSMRCRANLGRLARARRLERSRGAGNR